jgi:hypothetical protein
MPAEIFEDAGKFRESTILTSPNWLVWVGFMLLALNE